MLSSRTRFLKTTLTILGYANAQRALDLMIEEMNAKKGYCRHDGSDYYLHLVDVAQKLLNFGVRDEITITAAILHDAIEDVPWINYEYIYREYGKEVADTVQIVTKKPNIDYKKDKEALVEYLNGCMQTKRSALIKTADRIHNFNTLGSAKLEKQLRVALETEEYFIPFFKYCRNEYSEHANFFFQAKTEIEPHLLKIKESDVREKELQKQNEELKLELQKEKEKTEKLISIVSRMKEIFNPFSEQLLKEKEKNDELVTVMKNYISKVKEII